MVATPTDLLKAHDAMTDKLPPAHLRDLADQIWNASNDETMNALRRTLADEAARREAEAKTLCALCLGAKKWVGAKGAVYDCHACRELGQTASGVDPVATQVATPIVEREGLDSADDELAHSLRSVVTVDHSWPPMALSIIRRYETDRHKSADRIEAQARKLSEVRAARDRNIERAEAFRTERDTLRARVAELEATNAPAWLGDFNDMTRRAEQAEAKAARLVDALANIATHGRCPDVIRDLCDAALAEADHAGK